MPDRFDQQYNAWRVEDLLETYRWLSLVPDAGQGITIAGELEFTARPSDLEPITDAYTIRIEVPATFPRSLPRVWELGGRIPRDYHKLAEQALCLGSEIRLRIVLGKCPTLIEFVNKCVVPYLYGHTYHEKYGRLPFGELDHGDRGILDDLKALFDVETHRQCVAMLLLASAQKRKANRQLCPCGSGRRLGTCHHRMLNELRERCGRLVFRSEYDRLCG